MFNKYTKEISEKSLEQMAINRKSFNEIQLWNCFEISTTNCSEVERATWIQIFEVSNSSAC